MKAIAINGSPKMEQGITAAILTPFMEGLTAEGAEVELFHTGKLTIGPCLADLACWFGTPGQCSRQDDMQILLPRLADADLWILATPLYFDGMAGPLKQLTERFLPLVAPFFELREGHCRHPLREGTRSGKVVLVSTCAFWEMDNFDSLVAHVKAICRNANREFAGALLRPHSPALVSMAENGEPVGDVFEAAREAGRQLARDGAISPRTLDGVSRELLPLDTFVQAINDRFRNLLAERS